MDSRLLDILATIPVVFGAHTVGHVDAGDRYGFDIKIEPQTMSERLIPKMKGKGDNRRQIKPTKNQRAVIDGGGFVNQDNVVSSLGKDAKLISALYKLGYLAGIPQMNANTRGDFRRLQDSKGHQAREIMRAAVGISTISDLLKAYGKGLDENSDLKFWMSDTGAPGLMYSRRF